MYYDSLPYWTEQQLKHELTKNGHSYHDRFLQRVNQIAHDMRLHNETFESILKIINKCAPADQTPGKEAFIRNLERITFSPQCPPQYSSSLIHLIKSLRQPQSTPAF